MKTSGNKKRQQGLRALDRREFVRQAGQMAVGGVLSMNLAGRLFGDDTAKDGRPKLEKRNMVEGMSYVPLGKTNMLVSQVSLGGAPWEDSVARRAIYNGVNMVHGSNGYGTMEEQSKTLSGLWDKVWYVLKNTNAMDEDVDECLKTLKRDHVDIVVPVVTKTDGTDYDRIRNDFERLQKAGKVRKLGVTVHTGQVPEVCKEVIAADIFEMVLTMYQPARTEAIDKELRVGIEKNLGVMSMKTLQGAKDEQRRIAESALAGGTIHTILKGINNMELLTMMLEVAKKASSLEKKDVASAEQKQRLADMTACGACGACAGCPSGTEIQDVMRCTTYYERQGWGDMARQTYGELSGAQRGQNCRDCGKCEGSCPRGLAIRSHLQRAARAWA